MQDIVTPHSLVGLRVLSHNHVCPGSILAAADLPKPDPEILHRSLDDLGELLGKEAEVSCLLPIGLTLPALHVLTSWAQAGVSEMMKRGR